jgi:hypothetical protein
VYSARFLLDVMLRFNKPWFVAAVQRRQDTSAQRRSALQHLNAEPKFAGPPLTISEAFARRMLGAFIGALHHHIREPLVSSIPGRKQPMASLVLKMSVSLDGYVAPSDGSTDWVAAGPSDDSLSWTVETVSNAGDARTRRPSAQHAAVPVSDNVSWPLSRAATADLSAMS